MTLPSVATSPADRVTTSTKATIASNAAVESANPLLRSWSTEPFNPPPFKDIRAEHFEPAFEVAMAAHIADLEAIASSSSNDFDSILGAYDRAGGLLSKVGKLVWGL